MIRTTVVSLRIDWDDEFTAPPEDWEWFEVAYDAGMDHNGEGIELVYFKNYDI